MGAITVAISNAQFVTPAMAQSPIDHAAPEPLVWPALGKLPSGSCVAFSCRTSNVFHFFHASTSPWKSAWAW